VELKAMKNHIAADGESRLGQGQKALKSKSVEHKYAASLAKAGLDEKREIHQNMAEENLRREKMLNHKSSAGTLW